MTSARVAGRAPEPRQEPGRSRPPLRVVPDGWRSPRVRRRRARFFGLLAAVAAGVLVLSLVAFHVVLTQGQLQLERLQDRATVEDARRQRLRLEVAELESPQRVVAAAQQRLGMVPPPGVHYLSPSGVTGDPPGAPARPAGR